MALIFIRYPGFMTRIFIMTLLLCLGSPIFAQEQQGQEEEEKEGKSFGAIYGLHVGPLLPNQIRGMTEIMPVWGARYAIPIRKGHLEIGAANAQSYGTSYYNGSASYRGDFNLDDMYALAYAGLDVHYWNPPSEPYNMIFGFHAGGGFAANLGDLLWFRTDMKFNVNPGTALYIGFGLEWRQPGGGEGAEDQGQ